MLVLGCRDPMSLSLRGRSGISRVSSAGSARLAREDQTEPPNGRNGRRRNFDLVRRTKARIEMLIRIALVMALPAICASAPNIVVIFADDLGWNDVGYHGSRIKTPSIDSLANDGLELDRYYAHPVCSPTRAAFLTGRSPIRLGIDSPIGPYGGLPLNEHLMSESLRAAGYQTFMAGKWHLGIERVASHPYRRGFDRSYGHLGASVDYFSHVWIGGLDWHRNGEILREPGYSTELITREAVARIEGRDRSAPMFLYVAYNAPHTPLQVPDQYLAPYADIPNENRRTYAAMVSAMDEGVGEILAALDREVIWASDNGGARTWGASNAPLRGGKGNAFEGGIRVPAVIRWTGVLGKGQRFRQIITAEDWFPTLAAAAGFEPQNTLPFDGIDMWPGMRDGTQVNRRETVIGIGGNYAIFRDGWKLVEFTRRGDDQSATHLFRIDDDPSEENDMAAAMPDLAKELLQRLRVIPRPSSVSQDRLGPASPGRRPRARGKQPRPKAARAKAGRRPGRVSAANEPAPETRAPWIETAIRD